MSERGLVHVIDDDASVRKSLAFLLETRGYSVVLHVSADAFCEASPSLEGACVVTDVRMPGMSGVDLVRSLARDGGRAPVVVITGHADVPLAVEAVRAGAVDVLEKPFSDQRLVDAIELALTVQIEPPASSDAAARLGGLSMRERQVLEGVARGQSNKAIALDLDISPRTVEVYRAKLMAKAGVSTVPDLMRLALSAGL